MICVPKDETNQALKDVIIQALCGQMDHGMAKEYICRQLNAVAVAKRIVQLLGNECTSGN